MNIGDKVRFLNATGGGKITGFQGSDIVLVEDETGFEIPCMRNEVVVIETDQYNFVRKASTPRTSKETAVPVAPPTSLKAMLSAHVGDNAEEEETDIADRPMTFRARPVERRGADELNLYLGFLPTHRQSLTSTDFEGYFINDSNYFVHYLILTQEGTSYRLKYEGEAEPNMKVWLETFDRDALPELERLTLVITAYKRDRAFALKQPMCITVRIDGTKFYKLHTFQPSEFFDEAAYICELVRDDRPASQVSLEADSLQTALQTPKTAPLTAPARKKGALPGFKGTDRNGLIEVDLHIEQLLDRTDGMTAREILDYQLGVVRKTLDAHLKEKSRRIVFIHGKGDGVLRNELLKLLKSHYRSCTHQDASFQEYGFGATMVTIH